MKHIGGKEDYVCRECVKNEDCILQLCVLYSQFRKDAASLNKGINEMEIIIQSTISRSKHDDLLMVSPVPAIPRRKHNDIPTVSPTPAIPRTEHDDMPKASPPPAIRRREHDDMPTVSINEFFLATIIPNKNAVTSQELAANMIEKDPSEHKGTKELTNISQLSTPRSEHDAISTLPPDEFPTSNISPDKSTTVNQLLSANTRAEYNMTDENKGIGEMELIIQPTLSRSKDNDSSIVSTSHPVVVSLPTTQSTRQLNNHHDTSIASQHAPGTLRENHDDMSIASQHPPAALRMNPDDTSIASQHPPGTLSLNPNDTSIASQHPPATLRVKHDDTSIASHHPPATLRLNHDDMSIASQHPPATLSVNHDDTSIASQHPPATLRLNHNDISIASQHPPATQRLNHDDMSTASQHQPAMSPPNEEFSSPKTSATNDAINQQLPAAKIETDASSINKRVIEPANSIPSSTPRSDDDAVLKFSNLTADELPLSKFSLDKKAALNQELSTCIKKSDKLCRNCCKNEECIIRLLRLCNHFQKDVANINKRLCEMGKIIQTYFKSSSYNIRPTDPGGQAHYTFDRGGALHDLFSNTSDKRTNLESSFTEVFIKEEPDNTYCAEASDTDDKQNPSAIEDRIEVEPDIVSYCSEKLDTGCLIAEMMMKHDLVKNKRPYPGTLLDGTNEDSNAVSDEKYFKYQGNTLRSVGQYKCSICWKGFNRKDHLTKHMRTHSGEKPFECPECSKRFRGRDHLTMHMRTHSGEKPFECGECKKRFSIKDNLTRHKRIHSGEKPYQCLVCGRKFSDGSAMSRHKRIHPVPVQSHGEVYSNL